MSVLATIWDDLCLWLDARTASPFPAAKAAIVEGSYYHVAGEPYRFAAAAVAHAGAVWTRFQAEDVHEVLADPVLCRVLEGVGHLLGEQLGLSFVAATHFGDWLSQAITGANGGHGNEYVIAACKTIASGAVYGEREQHACGADGPEFWLRYPEGVRAVVAFLRA